MINFIDGSAKPQPAKKRAREEPDNEPDNNASSATIAKITKHEHADEENKTGQIAASAAAGMLADHSLSTDGKLRAAVKVFKGSTYVDVRQYWEVGTYCAQSQYLTQRMSARDRWHIPHPCTAS